MKILKAKVKKERGPTGCKFTYPAAWDASKIQVLAWGPGKGVGKQVEECLILAPDSVASKLIVAQEAVEITKAKVNELGRAWRPASVLITNEPVVASIVKKLMKSGMSSLSRKEKTVLDENDTEPGINRAREFDIDNFLS